jgi:RNA polymerase sigma-70 factor (ECF subfamily)
VDDERGELDRAALEALYLRLEKPLYNVVFRSVWDAGESRDVVQEAFLRLWRMRGRVRVETVEALVWRIALNLASKRRRAARRWHWVSVRLPRSRTRQAEAEQGVLAHERARSVREALERLPAGLRQVVVLCELSELSYEQIGRLLSIPAGTVGSRRHRAIALLREALGPRAETEAPVHLKSPSVPEPGP